jgi:hypothetical protein
MIQMAKEERNKQIVNNARMTTTIDYPCGCSYLFAHHVELKHVCPQHDLSKTVYIILGINLIYCKNWIKIQLTFEDMWLPLQDYFYRLSGSPVVFPYHPMLLLPTFEG